MEGPKAPWIVSVIFSLALVANGKRSGDRDEDNGILPRPTRNKQNVPDRKPELFNGLPDPDSSAQQVSPQISGYQGGLGGGQSGLLGNQGLYPGLQNQGLGQGQVGLNPYLGGGGGLGTGGFGTGVGFGTPGFGTGGFGGSNLGLGSGFQQNPYAFLGGQQDIYGQQGGLGGGLGGIYSQQSGLGGIYNTNPYLSQGQNPYLTNPYFQGTGGGISTQFLNSNINPYLLSQRGAVGGGYLQNPYLGGFGGSSLGGGFINPYNNFNPYNSFNSFPLASRFGLGVGRGGSLGSRSNTGTSSSSQSSNDD